MWPMRKLHYDAGQELRRQRHLHYQHEHHELEAKSRDFGRV